jgi:hypothetical protein
MKKIKEGLRLPGIELPPGKAKVRIINSSELGNYWSPARFCGGRCANVERCKLPERDKCKAVEAERKYLTAFYAKSREKLNELEQASLDKLKRKNK